MKTKAVRLYGENDLRLEEFELPSIQDDEILAKVVSDSICMSSYKAAKQGNKHKRVPDDCADNPVIIGHEFCGEIVEVGAKWKDEWSVGQKFSIQPAIPYKDKLYAPGYSFQYLGGDSTYVIIHRDILNHDCLLHYDGEGYFPASLSEPQSCIVGAFHANYHVQTGTYIHEMGIVEGGKTAILAGVGPMGLGAIDYALHCDRRPGLLVVTDIDDVRLERAASIFTVEDAKKNGVELVYVNTKCDNPVEKLLELSGGTGFDDVFVFAPVRPVVEQGDAILGRDGCMNFFAGPTDSQFKAEFNFYNVHYNFTKVVGTSGGNTDDMRESLALMSAGRINPVAMITHVGGLDSVIETTLNLPNIPGGKKLVYTEVNMPMTALVDFRSKAADDERFGVLADICEKNNMLWSLEAEAYLLANF